MGEAKNRGTYEERQAQGIARREADKIAAQRRLDCALREAWRCRRDKERERRIIASVHRHARPLGSALRRFALAASLAAVAAADFNKVHAHE